MKRPFAEEITEALGLKGEPQKQAIEKLLFWFREDEHITWTVTDVITQAEYEGKRITDEQATEVLQRIIQQHNADRGVNWSLISAHLKDFPDTNSED